MTKAYFIGIDIGTQGVRVALLDECGHQLIVKEESFGVLSELRNEQSPTEWWDICCRLIPEIITTVSSTIDTGLVHAIAVTSTSGTIIPIDANFEPLHPAIMYSDPRSAEEAKVCRAAAEASVTRGYTAFNASSGLPKMRWWLNNFQNDARRLFKFIHAADFITGRLSGVYGITDHTNAMKSGYDIHQYRWPEYIQEKTGILNEWLQQVVASGQPVGELLPVLAKRWRLPERVIITTGVTDGCASQIASGAVSPGQWNTTIGTTLVIKGVTAEPVIEETGIVYNHRHPAGYWMPGGASNTGADWVSKLFAGADLDTLNAVAARHLPAKELAWPLIQQGERFPFLSPQARGFWPEVDEVEKFVACMEGVAFIERYAYDMIANASGEKIAGIFTAGGASNSHTWMRIRSCVMNVPVRKMKNVSGAAGAAILAASKTYYRSLQDAAAAMVHAELAIDPEPALVAAYEQKYQNFIRELKNRKIIK